MMLFSRIYFFMIINKYTSKSIKPGQISGMYDEIHTMSDNIFNLSEIGRFFLLYEEREIMKKIISMLLLAVMLSSALEAFATMSYSDITNEHWAAEYIKQLTDKGILFGTPEGKYFLIIILPVQKFRQ